MKALVFGGTSGQVATSLQRQAGDLMKVQMLGRNSVDFRDGHKIRAAVEATDADVIINAAAYTAVDNAEREPELAEQVNHFAVAELGCAAASRAIPVLHISTDYVFSGAGDTPWKPEDPPSPLCVYGASKARGELALVGAGGSFSILRTSWVFSSSGSNFVSTMLRLGKQQASVQVVRDQVGGPTFADDIARALISMATQLVAGRTRPGIYHLAGTPDCSWADFATEIFAQSGCSARLVPILSKNYPTLALRPSNSRLDCTSLEQEFGIGRPDWHAGLRHVLNQMRLGS